CRIAAAVVELEHDGPNFASRRFDRHGVLRVIAELRNAPWVDLDAHAGFESEAEQLGINENAVRESVPLQGRRPSILRLDDDRRGPPCGSAKGAGDVREIDPVRILGTSGNATRGAGA